MEIEQLRRELEAEKKKTAEVQEELRLQVIIYLLKTYLDSYFLLHRYETKLIHTSIIMAIIYLNVGQFKGRNGSCDETSRKRHT